MILNLFPNVFWFTVSLFVIFAAQHFLAEIAGKLQRLSDSLAAAGRWRGGLKGGLDEIPKFAVLRIIFGLFLLNRAYLIATLAYPGDWNNSALAFAMVLALMAAFMLILGLFVQWTFIYLCVFHWQIGEQLMASSTLGNDVAALLALLLFLTNSGSRLSLDGLLLRRWRRGKKWLLYFALRDEDILAAKFLSLAGYWLVCVYSFAMHLAEPAWTFGYASPQLLTNNFMSRYFELFQTVFETFPPSLYLAIACMWIMLPWYFFLLPFVLLGGVLRLFIIIWALMFFSLSCFVLILGWLAEFEFILWAALFLYRSGKVDLLYDDRCNLCDRTVNGVKRVDLLNTIRLRPISQNIDWAVGKDLTQEDVLRDLHGIDERSGRVAAGYDLYLMLTRSVIALLPLWPVLYLGKVTRIGPAIYRFIADRRTRYFGVCALPTPKPNWAIRDDADTSSTRIVPAVAAHFLVLGLFFAISIPAPFVGWVGIHTRAAALAHTYGISPIDVFNNTDLKMSENWFTIHDRDGLRVPVFYPDGSRDVFHRSDRIYFGGTLMYRRWAINQPGCHFEEPFVENLVRNLASLHHDKNEHSGSFNYRQYHEEIAKAADILDMRYETNPTTLVCEVEFTLGTERLAQDKALAGG